MWKFFILLSVFVSVNSFPTENHQIKSISPEIIKHFRGEIPEDAYLNITQLITKYGYPVESHEVITEDGYILTMQRIPSGKTFKADDHKTPVLLMHGLLVSAVDWVINGPDKALGYLLADEGYDVWMGNARGNYHSRKHITLDPDEDSAFWKFSWNEIGTYDLPAMITYILEKTGRSKLHYVGHSQGGTSFLVMGSERPEFNDKILLMQGLAPASYMSHARSPVVKYLAPYVNSIEKMLELLGVNEFMLDPELTALIGSTYCNEDSPLLPVCTNFIFILCGFNPDQLNTTMLPVYMSHAPAGASSRQVIHYAQEYVSAKFRKFDHGTKKNLEIYGTETPPDYDMSRITAPVIVHYTDNDLLVDPIDVEQLYSELGNPAGLIKVPMPEFNHLDFTWGKDARTLLYDRMLPLMENYNQK